MLNKTVNESDPVQFNCSVTGNPPPLKVYWTKPDSNSTANGPELTIDNVTRENAGWYRCYAFNGIGNGTAESVHLNVQCML